MPTIPRASEIGRDVDSARPEVNRLTHLELRKILHDDSNNVVLVNVWATWCKPCLEEMPNLVSLWKAYHNKKFTLLLVSADDMDVLDTAVRRTLKKFGVEFPSYIINDSTDEAFMSAMSTDWSGALPASFFYNKQGALVETKIGERTYHQFEETVKRLLRE